MKTRPFIAAIVLLVSAMMLSSCDSNVLSGKPGSSGKTLELLVVANNSVYNGRTQLVIDTIFRSPQEALNQPEPRFDVVHIGANDFEDNAMFQAHRNILILEIGANNENKVYLEKDKWSSPQVVIRIAARDQHSLDSMMLAQSERLLKEYHDADYRRMAKVMTDMPNPTIKSRIKDKYGFSLTFSSEFSMDKVEDNFTWVRKETKDFGIGVLINTNTYAGPKDLEEAAILDRLDTMMKRYVPGPADGSYMGTERRDFFYTRNVTLNDTIDAVETRGLWRLYNDFMSGPFVCYSFVDPKNGQLVSLVGYVYSPSYRSKSFSKRDLLMQVDGICRTLAYD